MWFQGYILGCPEIDGKITANEKMVFTHRIGLISDELYNVILVFIFILLFILSFFMLGWKEALS